MNPREGMLGVCGTKTLGREQVRQSNLLVVILYILSKGVKC